MQTFPIQMKLCPLHLERLLWICMSLILLSHQIAVLLNLIRWDIHAQVDKKLLLLLKVIIWFQRWEVVNKGDWNRNEWCIVSRAISYKSYMQKVSWPLFWLMQNYVRYYITLWTHLMTSCPAACTQLLPLLSSTNCTCQTLSSRTPPHRSPLCPHSACICPPTRQRSPELRLGWKVMFSYWFSEVFKSNFHWWGRLAA